MVPLEALGLYSLEWPGLWATRPGSGRVLPYRLGAEVTVHPWSPPELAALFERTGIAWLGALDRTLQAGPKTGRWGYWLGLPPLRQALNAMLGGDPAGGRLAGAALPPLPEGRAAGVHRALAAARRAVLAARFDLEPRALARAVWALEPRTGGGYGHGLLALGRLT